MDLSNLDNTKLGRSLLFALVVWASLAILGFIYEERVSSTLAPYYEWVTNKITHGYIHKVSVASGEKEHLWLISTPLENIAITPDLFWPAGKTIPPAKVTSLHTLVPIVILLTILFSFPMKTLKQRISLWIMAIPGILIIAALTTPIQMLGLLELGFIEGAAKYNHYREPTLIIKWNLAMEGGGRWLLPILTALLLIYLVKAIIKE